MYSAMKKSIAVALAAAAVLLTGCGSDSDEAGAETTAAATPQAETAGAESLTGHALYLKTCDDITNYLTTKGVETPEERADTVRQLMAEVEPSAEWAGYDESDRDQVRNAATAAQQGTC